MQSFKDDLLDYLTTNASCSMPMWLKRVRPDLKAKIEEETAGFSTKNIMEQLYIVLNGAPPICSDGNTRQFNTFEKGYRTGCKLGHKCKDVASDRVANQRISLQKKYGVSSAMDVPGAKDKFKKTNLEKYGVEYPAQNASIIQKTVATRNKRTTEDREKTKKKAEKTSIQKYGTTHHMKVVTQQEKVKSTNLTKYGVEFPLQNEVSIDKLKETIKKLDRNTIISKTKQTILDRYGVDAVSRIHLSEKTLSILDNKDLFCNYVCGKERKDVLSELNIADHTLYLYAKEYQAQNLFKRPLTSEFEKEVASFLEDLGVVFTQNDRTILSPKELDFYIPGLRIAIECCGLYWHSEISAGRGKEYHVDKFTKCKESGVKLITIFHDEWINKRNLVKKMLTHSFGVTPKLSGARKCKVVECSMEQASVFLDNNHIQGSITASVKLGLTYEDKLVALMTFGKPRYNKTHEWELIRYCSSGSIPGAATKLLKYFIKTYSANSIISYSDNRWFSGEMYKSLGFKETNTTVGFFYTDYVSRYNRLMFQKHTLVNEGFDASKTEWQIMQERGFDRIWDCGQIRWEYNT